MTTIDKSWVARYLARMNSPARHDKFSAYRARKKAAGLREVRMWVPDVRQREYWERSEKAAAVLNSAPEEAETTEFLDALQEEMPGDWD